MQLFDIYHDVISTNQDVTFDFSNCGFLRPNAVAFLGGVARLARSRNNKRVEFDWTTLRKGIVLTNLCQNGFARSFGHVQSDPDDHSIPYREDLVSDFNSIMDYLTDFWIGKGWVHVTERLRNAIAGNMWEIYSNAFEHSRAELGIFSCGHHYQNTNDLILSVVDFGQGIPGNVRAFLRPHVDEAAVAKLPDSECLRWAFKPGNTTISGPVRRGLGLDLLRQFVRVNQGKLELYSNGGYVRVDKDGECYQEARGSFEGTAVHITLRCDEKLYRFRGEMNPDS